MRIAMVCYPTVGGSGVLATELGKELAQRGHQVHFISYEAPFRLKTDHENLFFHPVQMQEYEVMRYPDYALALAVKIAEITREYNLDILHVHYAIPHATSAFLAKQLLGKQPVPAIITTLHGTDITLVGRDPAYFRMVQFSIEQSDGVTAVSQALKRQTQDFFKIEQPIEVIYNFCNPTPELFDRRGLKHHIAPNGEKILAHASNFREVKRPEDVVRIFALVRQQIAAKLVLVGTGSQLETVQRLVHQLDLQQDVLFVGKSMETDRYLASSDLFLLPSAEESFGLAALEAMAYGVPVIASAIGGLPELVEHGETGFLATVGDVDTMTRYALQILQDPTLASQLGIAAQKRASTYFNAGTIVPQYEAFYRQVLEGKANN